MFRINGVPVEDGDFEPTLSAKTIATALLAKVGFKL